MSREHLYDVFAQEVARVDAASTAKRDEFVIDSFTDGENPRAISEGKEYSIFDSNDYLGLRFSPRLRQAEHDATERYGTSPGAVRFICGTMKVYQDLEDEIARFHEKAAGMTFSSAFATNVGVIHALCRGRAAGSLISDSVLVLSDQLNHRSIIEGLWAANLPSEKRLIYPHFGYDDLQKALESNVGKQDRAIILTDGVFSMLGEYVDLKRIREIADEFDEAYTEGVTVVVDDSHGVGAFGKTGRGVEEVCGAEADVLIGTFGKAFGADGGYVVAQDKRTIDLMRETAATYIYSNPTSPGTAGAALEAVRLVNSEEGKTRLAKLQKNIEMFKTGIQASGFTMAADSIHPIQPVLIGDTAKTAQLRDNLKEKGFKTTNISYPVVPQGKDEIRVQMSAIQTEGDINQFVSAFADAGKELGII